jgi:predicted O-methyltransferase YrrM
MAVYHHGADLLRKARQSGERVVNLFRLSRQEDSACEAVARSLRAALSQVSMPEERGWIDRIEKLRNDLNVSDKAIVRIDYGAGSPGEQRTAAEMDAGVDVQDTLGRVSKAVSKPPFWCLVLFKLLRTLQPRSCVEMGTAVGISAAYQAAALRLNGRGTLTTLEGAGSLADIARSNLEQLGLGDVEVVVGRFRDTLTGVLSSRQPVDYVFVDGHHDEQATLAYFETMHPFLAEKALLVFDDIAWSADMKRCWQAIVNDRRVTTAVDLGPVGLCIVGGAPTRQRRFSIPLGE